MNVLRLAVGYLSLALVLVFCACSKGENSTAEEFDIEELKSMLDSGDVVFRRGRGAIGRAVRSVDSEGRFSHVGIALIRNGEWCVVHAVPGESEFEGDFDRVKCESIELFLSEERAARCAVYRPELDSNLRIGATKSALRLSEKRVRFDHDYNLDDTTRLYCTELVEYVYLLEGVSLSEGRRTRITFPSLSGDHIMPSDLSRSSKLKHIYSF